MTLRPFLAAAGLAVALVFPAASQEATPRPAATCPAAAMLRAGTELTLDVQVSAAGQPSAALQIALIENSTERRIVEYRLQQPRRTERLEGQPPAGGRGPFFPTRMEMIDRTGAQAPVTLSAGVSEPTDQLAERIVSGPTTYHVMMSNQPTPIGMATEPRPSPPIEIGGCTYETLRWQATMTHANGVQVQDMVNVPALGLSFPVARRSGTTTLTYTPLAVRLGPPQQVKRDAN
jgi:hypothetical protein